LASGAQEVDRLGEREVDRLADWSDRIGHYDIDSDYWVQQKVDHPAHLDVVGLDADDNYAQLNARQKLFCDTLLNHFRQSIRGQAPHQLLLHLDSEGGTGKTMAVGIW